MTSKNGNDKSKGSTLIMIVGVIFILAIAGYLYWAKSDYYVHFSDDGVELKKGFTSSNEEEAADLLVKYAAAQKTFHEHKGFLPEIQWN